ncbi:hypothetical protein QUF61_03500 [Candidatus Venteria ishoeyi]|uniref:hypothetical protein n=1 Tax=Candidatus Venteria ishoeyi TaxID=1899563 RepID=UPI0025A56517|nr:hypothetical protein [Candidatus Venteria ishoeyi]MDM8545539.1 hypothetical protein [Candidatus Venteria ishoeyi]
MNEVNFLLWVRGIGFDIALAIFVFGIMLRFMEILWLGRKPELAAVRGNGVASGMRTVFSRFLPADSNTLKRSLFMVVAGYGFHIGLFVVIFLFAPHAELIESVTGLSWPTLPSPIVDFFTVLTMLALMALLWRRLTHPVLRFLSTGEDYLMLLLTFLPVLTGYMAFHHLFLSYGWMLGLHILSVELLLIVIPFTKLIHMFTLFMARWYSGFMAGQKGVQS